MACVALARTPSTPRCSASGGSASERRVGFAGVTKQSSALQTPQSEAGTSTPLSTLPPTPPPPVATPRPVSHAALFNASRSPNGRGGSGQGPFKPSASHRRALFGVIQAGHDIRSALGRIDPEFSDGTHKERALLAGMEILLCAAEQTMKSAQNNLGSLGKKTSLPPTMERTPKYNDPRSVIKDQLKRMYRIAKDAHGSLAHLSATLHDRRDELYARLVDLALVNDILVQTVDEEQSHSLTKSAVRSPDAERPWAARMACKPACTTSEGTFTPEQPSALRWKKLLGASNAVEAFKVRTPEGKVRPEFNARIAVAASTPSPWSGEEDTVLLSLLVTHGLNRWPKVAEEVPREMMQRYQKVSAMPRLPGTCRSRWETIINVFLSNESAPGIKRTSEILTAARKALRDTEAVMNECAGVLTRARSELQLASVRAQKLSVEAAELRSWLRSHTHVKLNGIGEEHQRLAHLLEKMGPKKLLERKLAEAERLSKGLDDVSLADELQLDALVIEVKKVAGGVGAKPRHILRVRDMTTAEICLEWEEPRERPTDPAGETEDSPGSTLMRKLHTTRFALDTGSQGGSSSCSAASSRLSSPRPSIVGSVAGKSSASGTLVGTAARSATSRTATGSNAQ